MIGRNCRPAVAVLAMIACTESAVNTSNTASVDTLPSGIIRVANQSEGRQLPRTELLRIGVSEGEDPYVFERIVDLELGKDGRVYALDAVSRELRIYAPDGGHMHTVGGPGSGPGEFRDPRGLSWSARGTLWIMDFALQRYTELSQDGALLATYSRAVPALGTSWEGGFDASGHLYDIALSVIPRPPTRMCGSAMRSAKQDWNHAPPFRCLLRLGVAST